MNDLILTIAYLTLFLTGLVVIGAICKVFIKGDFTNLNNS